MQHATVKKNLKQNLTTRENCAKQEGAEKQAHSLSQTQRSSRSLSSSHSGKKLLSKIYINQLQIPHSTAACMQQSTWLTQQNPTCQQGNHAEDCWGVLLQRSMACWPLQLQVPSDKILPRSNQVCVFNLIQQLSVTYLI